MSRNSTHINCNQTVGTANQGIWANDCDPCATSPFSIPNIILWHRYNHGINGHTGPADILTNVADGTAVSQWDDQIGTNHAVQATGADQPTWFTIDASLTFSANEHMDLTTGVSYSSGEKWFDANISSIEYEIDEDAPTLLRGIGTFNCQNIEVI